MAWRKREIMEMAREVKMPYDFVTGEPINLEKLEAFANLVREEQQTEVQRLIALVRAQQITIDKLEMALAQPEQEPVAWGMPGKDGFIFDVICPEEHTREEGGYTIPLYTTPPQRTEQEPVAYINVEKRKLEWAKHMSWNTPTVVNLPKIPLYTTPPTQEFVCSTGLCHFTLTQTNVGIGVRGMEAYEAAKKRGWVGVSDERMMEMPKQEPEKRECMNCAAFGECHPNNDAGRCGYEPPAAQRQWVGLDDTDIGNEYVRFEIIKGGFNRFEYAVRAIEAKLRERNHD
jgi:hypothetical protein